jgi:acyl carrier protein
MPDVESAVRDLILAEFLPGEAPELLTDSTPLVTGGILDSIATMKLATLLEQRFSIELQAHELSTDNLDSVAAIARLVRSKQKA